MKGQKQKYGGQFNDKLDAAKRVNQLCEELGIPHKNPTISAMPNQQYQVTKKYFFVSWYCEKIRIVEIDVFNYFPIVKPELCYKLKILLF